MKEKEKESEDKFLNKKKKKSLKEVRETQYKSMTKECANAKLNISEIRIEDFAQSRKSELTSFIKILGNKYKIKSGFQSLPRHMRRRAMTHNPFRVSIPARVLEVNSKSKTKIRKHKRTKANLRKSIRNRAINNSWLETHLWHSKRFKMKKIFGYTIANERLDKGFKACYRYSQYDACIHDQSYYNTILIKENAQDILGHLSKQTFPRIDNLDFYSVFCLKTNIYDLNKKLIGPIDVILINRNSCLLSYHTLMQEELYTLFSSMWSNESPTNQLRYQNSFFYTRLLNKFSIIGQQATERLYKILKSLEIEEKTNELLTDVLSFQKELHYAPEGSTYILRTRTPKSEFKMTEFVFNKVTSSIMNKVKEIEMDIDDKSNLSSSNNIKSKSNGTSSSFQVHAKQCDEESAGLFIENLHKICLISTDIKHQDKLDFGNSICYIEKPTERTLFSHRKKQDMKSINNKIKDSKRANVHSVDTKIPLQKKNNKDKNSLNKLAVIADQQDLAKISKKKSSSLEKGLSLSKSELSSVDNQPNLKYAKINKYESLKDLKDFISISDETTFLIVKKTAKCKQGRNQYDTPYFELYFFPSMSLDILRRFNYIETKVLGLKEFKYYFSDSETLVFPDDYPLTKSYKYLSERKTMENIEKYYKLPASKRVNYQRIGNPFPFNSSWESVCNLDISEINSDTISIIINPLDKRTIDCQLKNQGYETSSLTKLPSNKFLVPLAIESWVDGGLLTEGTLLFLPTQEDFFFHKNKQDFTDDFFSKTLNEIQRLSQTNDFEKIGLLVQKMNEYTKYKTKDGETENNKLLEPLHKILKDNKLFNKEIEAILTFPEKKYDSSIINKHFNIILDKSELYGDSKFFKCNSLPTKRKIIGFITTGGLSFSKCKGFGRGFVSLECLKELLSLKKTINSEKLLILAKERDSRVYKLCTAKVISMTN